MSEMINSNFEDLSDIYFDESNVNNIQKKVLGRKKILVWEYFEEDGEKKIGISDVFVNYVDGQERLEKLLKWLNI
jgi:hypothetical protein